VVVSEDSTHFAPLEPGRHFLTGRAEDLDRLVDELLDSPERLDAMRRAAYEYIRSALPMSNAASMIAEAADAISALPAPPRRRKLPRPRRPRGVRNAIGSVVRRRARSTAAAGPPPPEPRPDPTPATEPTIRHQTAAWGERRPISVIVAADEHSELVGDALDSTISQAPGRVEMIVVATGAAEAARCWFDEHASVPGLLLGGLGHQAAIAHAHGDVLLAMRSGDQLLPNGVERLSFALAADPEAAFAYGIIRVAGDHGPDRLDNHFGWEPARLADADYIRLPALIRRSALERVGGYPANPWYAFAEHGLHGAHVRQLVASSRAPLNDAAGQKKCGSCQTVASGR
jgi:hypothetical protein